MHTARLSALMVLAAVAACQSLIDLGEEPEIGCGIARAPGPACAECLETKCCEASFACSQDSACKEAAETCLVNCFDGACIEACLAMYRPNQPLDDYFTCASECATECVPDENTACGKLSECCPSVTDATLHDGCIRNARSENQVLCGNSLIVLGCEGQGGAPSM